jgi:hypothetical protein
MSRNEQSSACNTSSHLFVEPDVLHAPIVDDTVDHLAAANRPRTAAQRAQERQKP